MGGAATRGLLQNALFRLMRFFLPTIDSLVAEEEMSLLQFFIRRETHLSASMTLCSSESILSSLSEGMCMPLSR